MPIQRQYSLPNCVLILEGLSNAPETATAGNRPELSVLTRFECYFAREKQALIGGRELLEGLVQATNTCVQSWLSGMRASHRPRNNAVPKVQLNPSTEGGFDLIVAEELLFQPLAPEPGVDASAPVTTQLHISSLQLFDLMEAVDQLAADQQTLPELQTAVQPRSRQDVLSGQRVVEQTGPIAMGATSLAVAAAALFLVPVPKVPTPPKTLDIKPSSIEKPIIPISGSPQPKSSGQAPTNLDPKATTSATSSPATSSPATSSSVELPINPTVPPEAPASP